MAFYKNKQTPTKGGNKGAGESRSAGLNQVESARYTEVPGGVAMTRDRHWNARPIREGM